MRDGRNEGDEANPTSSGGVMLDTVRTAILLAMTAVITCATSRKPLHG